MNGPIQLGAFNQNPAAQQQMLQQQAQQRAMAEQATQKRMQMQAEAQQQRSQQALQGMQGGGMPVAQQGGMAQMAGAPQGGGQQPPSLMEQLGTAGSPASSALLNFGLETMNAAHQGRSTGSSLAAGLGGGAGAYIGGKQLESQNASLAEKEEFDRRMRELQMAQMGERMKIAQSGGAPGSMPSYARQAPGMY